MEFMDAVKTKQIGYRDRPATGLGQFADLLLHLLSVSASMHR